MAKLNNLGQLFSSTAHRFFLAIPDNVDPEIVGSIRSFIDAANELGISTQNVNKNALQITHDSTVLAGGLFTLTEKGIALSAEYLSKLIKKFNAHSGTTPNDIVSKVSQANTLLSTISSVLSTALAGVDLDNLIKEDNKTASEVAQGALNIVGKTLDIALNSVNSIDKLSEVFSVLGNNISNVKGLAHLSSALKNTPNLNFGTVGTILDGASGILGGVDAGFILGSQQANADEKIAAGFELANRFLSNITKTVSQILLAQRIASGASLTGPAAGLIASSVTLAISPLAFYGVAKKFEYSKELYLLADRFSKHGYEGDSYLASFYKETGIADAGYTTATTILGAVSAGIGAASAGSLVGAPIALIVGAVTGIISGILDATKQAAFESIANKYQQKILAWEKEHPGQNFFDSGYTSRYKEILSENMVFLKEISETHHTDSLVAITQQGWDQQLGELAAITKLGDKISGGKVFSDIFKNGEQITPQSEVIIDPMKGEIVLSSDVKSQALVFLTPLMSATEESRVRLQTGKNAYLNELRLGKYYDWNVTDSGDTNTTVDFSRVTQRIVFNDGKDKDLLLHVHLGAGNDTAYISEGGAVIDGGSGFDIVDYTKSKGDWAEFNAIDAQSGNYNVNRHVSGEIYKEIVSTQESAVGKRTEKIEYREIVLEHDSYNTVDKLMSVEKVIGTNWRDIFQGGEQADRFDGADGHDNIYGNGGNDFLSGGEGNDSIYAGKGNDFLNGGKGDDHLHGGEGNDTYIINKNEGHDVISDTSGKNDLLVLENINSDELSFKQNGRDLKLIFDNSENSVTFRDWFYYEHMKSTHENYQIKNKTDNKIEAILTKDKKVITSDKIDYLIAAMSQFNVSDIANEPNKIFDESLAQKFTTSSLT
ncbi:hypothetical protein DV589_24970 [Salmonella enterica]|nr:hypothetical protein [Salmonella enterica]EKF0974717.1 hypothetical protein [Salmonella enterica]